MKTTSATASPFHSLKRVFCWASVLESSKTLFLNCFISITIEILTPKPYTDPEAYYYTTCMEYYEIILTQKGEQFAWKGEQFASNGERSAGNGEWFARNASYEMLNAF